jgi:hypothetical protein
MWPPFVSGKNGGPVDRDQLTAPKMFLISQVQQLLALAQRSELATTPAGA